MDLPPSLVAVLNTIHGGQSRPPMDILPVPKEHIQTVLTLAQKFVEIRGVGKMAAKIELWRYINKVMPYTSRKDTRLNVHNPTAPAIEIHGKYPVPVLGKNDVVAIYNMPASSHYKLFELMDFEEQGPLHSYNLWTYIGEVVPAVAANQQGSWSIQTEGNDVWIVLREKKEEDEE